jgi:hypothetical protein
MIARVNAAMSAAHPTEELVSLHDPLTDGVPDLAHEPGAAEGYEAWLAEREQCEAWSDLLAWAQVSLTCAPIPCTCLRTLRCLRCRTTAIVESEVRS